MNIFSYYINRDDEGKILKNKQVGHMLRTKLSEANEGGVAAGSGALDSVFLLDVDRCCEIEAETRRREPVSTRSPQYSPLDPRPPCCTWLCPASKLG